MITETKLYIRKSEAQGICSEVSECCCEWNRRCNEHCAMIRKQRFQASGDIFAPGRKFYYNQFEKFEKRTMQSNLVRSMRYS